MYVPTCTRGISLATGTRHFGKLGAPAEKYPVTGYSLAEIPGVGYGYGYKQPYHTQPFGGLGKTAIPVPDPLASSVRHSYQYPTLW